MNPQIFREYDIRGVADSDLTDEAVENIGRAYATLVQRDGVRNVAVGHDNRLSSPRLAEALISGLRAAGSNVLFAHQVPTPTLYFTILHYQQDGGVQVTGSHNPPQFNGFKMSRGVLSLYGDQVQELRRIIEAKDFATGNGSLETVDPVREYQQAITSRLKLQRPLKIVVDTGNGTAGPVIVPILREMGAEVVELYTEPDGTFPNHVADPTVPENLADLIATVQSEHADLGLATDGDADRVGAVDDLGNIIWGDRLLILFARDLLTRQPGAKIIFDVKCSQAVVQDVEAHGGKPIMWRVGHSHIKAKMKEEAAPLAAEMSGHMYFAENWFGFDDGIYSACRLAELVSRSKQPFSAMLDNAPHYVNSPEIRVSCPDDVKFGVVDRLLEYYKARHPVIDIDGARVLFDDGWALVRASNTEPKLVLRFEGKSKESIARMEREMREKIAELGGTH